MISNWLKFVLLATFLFFGSEAVSDELKIGMTVSNSGKYAAPSQQQLKGVKLWVEDINKAGGLMGKKVRLVIYDDESDEIKCEEFYSKLIQTDKVDILLGPYSSSLTLAASTMAESFDFPMISAGASSTKIWSRGYQNIFGLYTPASNYMDQILEFAVEKNLKTIALIYTKETFPIDVAEGTKNMANALGLEIVFTHSYSKNSTDFHSVIRRLNRINPDVLIGGSYLEDSIAFVRQARELNFSPSIMAFAVGPALPEFQKRLGVLAHGVMGNAQWEPSLSIDGIQQFVTDFETRYGEKPGYHAAGGYGAGQIVEEALKQTGNLDKNRLRSILRQLESTSIFGDFRVNPLGQQIGKPSYTIQWQNDERRVVLPKKYSDHAIIFPFRAMGE